MNELRNPIRTQINIWQVERRARHKYTIRRPRALQYSYRRKVITPGDEHGVLAPNEHGHAEKSDISSHLPEAVAKQRERLDLFIDLIWVGIIGNLSEVFSTFSFSPEYSRTDVGTLVFILVFLPSWRIWNTMREFLNNYYMDDMVQRIFQFWVLVLSVFYGNQLAYLPEDIEVVKCWAITVYLIIHSSFLMIENVYSIWIPWLRKLCLFGLILRLPGVGLWVGAIFVPGIRAAGLIIGAIFWEYMCPLIMDSRLVDRLTPMEYKKALDLNHFQSRMANFFIIVLGEGVLQLITNGPLGLGLNVNTGNMSWVLMIYYAFSFLYFIRDGSKTYMPAVRHGGWRFLAFVWWHIPLFSSLLCFVASVMFILRHQYEVNDHQKNQEALTGKELDRYIYRAVWTCATSLAIIMLALLVLALLDKPMDKKGTLRVDNRYIRLGSRVVYIIVILCLPIAPMSPDLFLGIAGFGLVVVSVYEWNCCLEKGGGFIEPRGLTLMMNHELKGNKQVTVKHVAVSHGDIDDHPKHKFSFRGSLAHG